MSKAVPNVIRLPIILRELTVKAVSEVSPTMRRITLAGAELGSFSKDGFDIPSFRSEGPDDHVKILLRDPKTGALNLPKQLEGTLDWSTGRPTGRSYTPRGFRPESGELQLDFVLHGHGPAGNWAANAKPGDLLHIAGPKSSLLVPEDADWYVLAGDETALPAIANWLEILRPDAKVAAFIQVTSPDARIDLKAPTGAMIEWLVDPELKAETLTEALRRFAWWEGEGFVWGAAEREAVKLLRRYLLDERGHDRDALDVVAYWHKGLDHSAREIAHDRLHQLTDLLAPHAVRVATTLRLPDLVASGATSVVALVEKTGASPLGLETLVPVLLEYGVLEGTPDALKLGLMGQMLREDQHDFDHFDLDGANARMDLAWAGLRQAVMSGSEGYSSVFGRPFWNDITSDVDLAASFDEELGDFAQYWSIQVAKFIDLPKGGLVADVGGGNDVLLAALLELRPDLRGALVELPTAVNASRPIFERKGLLERVDLHPRSFFEPLPAADAVILAQVLHNWPDAEAEMILKRAAEAVGETGSVFVVERDHDPAAGLANATSALQMLVLFGGRERELSELDALAAQAGLVRERSDAAGPRLQVTKYARVKS